MNSSSQWQRRRSGGVLEVGLGLAALGILMLLLPVFMDTPLQRSALEPLEPVGWILLLLGAATCAWHFRPASRRELAGQSLDDLIAGMGATSHRRRRKRKSRERNLEKEAARRSALQAAIDENIARITAQRASELARAESVESDMGPETSTLSEITLPAPAPSGPSAAAAALRRAFLPADPGESRQFADTELAPPPRPAENLSTPAGEPPRQWSHEVFRLIEWRRFEAVMETLFEQAGFRTRPDKSARDGAAIWLFSRHARRAVSVAAYRHGAATSLDVNDMRRFHQLIRSRGLARGTFVTPGVFTDDALAYAARHGINAMDGDALLALIAQRTPDQQAELLGVAFEGEYWRPTCLECGVKLVQRGVLDDGSPRWTCENDASCPAHLPTAA